MSAKIRIAPSLLSADFACLRDELQRVEAAGCEVLHLDIMDGHFVPNLTFGAPIIERLRPLTKLHFDVHLMIDNPEKYLKSFADAGADGLTVHLEVCPQPAEILQRIGEMRLVRGLSINPDVPTSRLRGHLQNVDRLLLMSVFPGFGGQKFIPESLSRLRECKQLIGDLPIELEIDGGVNFANAAAIREAGATLLVAGTSTFGAPDFQLAVRQLSGAV